MGGCGDEKRAGKRGGGFIGHKDKVPGLFISMRP